MPGPDKGTLQSGTAAVGAVTQTVMSLCLPLIHLGMGCLVWRDHFSLPTVWDRQLS